MWPVGHVGRGLGNSTAETEKKEDISEGSG